MWPASWSVNVASPCVCVSPTARRRVACGRRSGVSSASVDRVIRAVRCRRVWSVWAWETKARSRTVSGSSQRSCPTSEMPRSQVTCRVMPGGSVTPFPAPVDASAGLRHPAAARDVLAHRWRATVAERARALHRGVEVVRDVDVRDAGPLDVHRGPLARQAGRHVVTGALDVRVLPRGPAGQGRRAGALQVRRQRVRGQAADVHAARPLDVDLQRVGVEVRRPGLGRTLHVDRAQRLDGQVVLDRRPGPDPAEAWPRSQLQIAVGDVRPQARQQVVVGADRQRLDVPLRDDERSDALHRHPVDARYGSRLAPRSAAAVDGPDPLVGAAATGRQRACDEHGQRRDSGDRLPCRHLMPPPWGCPAASVAAAPAMGSWAAAPGWRAAAPGWRAAAPGWRAAAPGWRAAAPGWRAAAPGWRAAAPGWRAAKPGWRA